MNPYLTSFLKGVTVALCQYEVVGIVTGKVPTLSELRREHHWMVVVLPGAVLVHLLVKPKEYA